MVNTMYKAGVLDNRFLSRSIGYLNPQHPVVVTGGATLREVVELLRDNSSGCVVIVNDEGVISGIFSDRDVVLKLALNSINLDSERIDSLMTLHPETAHMTTTVAFVLTMMSEGGYRHMPIIDEQGRPVGLVSVKDIVNYLVRAMDKDSDRLAGLG